MESVLGLTRLYAYTQLYTYMIYVIVIIAVSIISISVGSKVNPTVTVG